MSLSWQFEVKPQSIKPIELCMSLNSLLVEALTTTQNETRFIATYSCTIARALMTKAQVICARSKENISVFRFL